MAADLIYNIDNLKKAKTAIDNLIDDLDQADSNLNTKLTELQQAWDTTAGKEFFEDHKNNWSIFVKKYTKKLTGVSSMLNKAINEYEKVATEVKNLKI